MKNTKMLKKNYEFKLVLTKGKYYSGKCIEAFVIKNNEKNNKLRNCHKDKTSEKLSKEITLND